MSSLAIALLQTRDPYDWLVFGCDVALALVGIGGIIIAICTLRKIEHQTKAGEDAAKAALLNAQAVINAERPWLVARIERRDTGVAGFSIRAENKGNTPGMIVSARMGANAAEDMFHPPSPPPYSPDEFVKDRLVVRDGLGYITWVNREKIRLMVGSEHFAEAIEGKRTILLFGSILYRDVLNPNDTLPHETRWVYIFQLTEDGDDIHDLEGVGWVEGYSKHT